MPSSFYKGIDEGIKRRIEALIFNNIIKPQQMIVDIAQKILSTEGELLLALAISGLINLEKNHRNYSIPQSSTEYLKQWQTQADPIIGFAEECISFEQDAPFVSSHSIYQAFLAWCHKEGREQSTKISKNSFLMRFKHNLNPKIISSHTRLGNGYINLKLLSILG